MPYMAIQREMIQKVILIDSNQTKSIKFKQLYACRSGVYCCIFSANVLQHAVIREYFECACISQMTLTTLRLLHALSGYPARNDKKGNV